MQTQVLRVSRKDTHISIDQMLNKRKIRQVFVIIIKYSLEYFANFAK